ncbi:hypothetical protein QYE76_028772, partial [Lolium multiflorum]
CGGFEMASPINFNQFLEKEKLKSNGSNFTDWFRHVRIFLSGGNLQFVLDAPLGDPPAEDESDEVKAVYATRKTRYSQVQCAILCSLESDLQKRFEHHDPHELMNELKAIFETHAAVECYEASKHFFSCMMEEGSSVSEHMLAMTGHAKKLSDLGIVIPNRLGINRVLQSLPPSYKNFVMNYNMQNMNKELPELFGMLKAAEIEIKKEHQVLMVNKTTSFKKQGKSKGKFKKGGKKAATPPMKPKNGPKPDAECYYCKEKGHWKRNCSKYLADLKSGLVKKKKEGIFDIHVIDVHFTGSRSSTWVFDTGSVAHICNSKQELKNKRQLLKDEVTMRVGNGSKVNVIAVGTLPLHLPSGLVLSLNNCYYVPALSMNIISGSCLMQDGYSFKSENNGCSIFMNNIFYGRAPQKNGLFLLDLDSSDTHIHNIDAKRIKLNDNSTYMWHCRLGHIGVKRMKKLHTDGLLESLDFESLDRCEACLMGKMTKTPFSGMMERATDLLEIIHTDVCGPMSVASRGGYRYVLTFTDDLSRYGYIYFMKHKSETFEKFKEFQSEVENQRNKKIKFLRSDRGGEYLSYEFGMHLKKCGILSQLTPPGTPQRNGVSERRNRTLLDMVRSMMSLTDLPLSFWSYALETAAFTLNRAPSKSVETTPYELWFNKKSKLSFLKVWGCEAYVKKLQPDKLEPKAEKCVFIGYPKETIGYTFYHRSEGKIFVAKNGTFLEKEFLTKEVTGRKVELDEIDESILVDQSSAVPEVVPVPPTPATEEANDNDHETSNEETTEPRRSTRERATPDWYDPCLNVMIVDNNDEDPATYEEAMMSPDSNKRQEAMKSEMGSMYDNKVWTLVDLPDSRKAVENKWIFKRKTDADGKVRVDVAFGGRDNCRVENLEFEVVDLDSPYHALLGRPALAAYMATTHTAYLKMKMPAPRGPLTVVGNYKISLETASAGSNLAESLVIAEEKKRMQTAVALAQSSQLSLAAMSENMGSPAFKPTNETKDIVLDPAYPERTVRIGVPRELAEHSLNVRKDAKPVRQPLRRFAEDRRKIIGEEVTKLLVAGFIVEVTHTEWLANPVMVEKKKDENLEAKAPKVKNTLIDDIRQTFDNLRRFRMKLNPAKCTFGVPAGKLLGFLVSSRGIEVNPADAAFKELKTMLATAPILASPLEREPMLLYIAATNRVVSVVVVVEREEEGKTVQRPVYYLSEVLSLSKQNYPHFQKMTYGVYMAATKLKHYFEEHPMKVVSEAPISDIMCNKDASGRIAKWAIQISPYVPVYERRDAIKSQALADFLVDWAEMQYKPPDQRIEYWKMHFDGSKLKEGLGAGVVLTSPKGDHLRYVLQVHFRASNNVAEYEALIHGLKVAKEIGAHRIICYGDSDLVVQQCSGDWDAKDANMALYRFHVQKIAGFFEGCEFHHVPQKMKPRMLCPSWAHLGKKFLPE